MNGVCCSGRAVQLEHRQFAGRRVQRNGLSERGIGQIRLAEILAAPPALGGCDQNQSVRVWAQRVTDNFDLRHEAQFLLASSLPAISPVQRTLSIDNSAILHYKNEA